MLDNQTISPDLTDKEIEDIYKEVDGQEPDNKNIDKVDPKNPADDSQPDEVQKEDEAGKPEDKPNPEGEDDQDGAPKETDPKEGKVQDPKPEEVKEPTPEEVQAYAVKHKLTQSEAEAEMKATRAILKNYKSPEDLARAYRIQQSAYDKLRNETVKAPEQPIFQRLDLGSVRTKLKAFLVENGEAKINSYRESFPAQTALMSDEMIIEELAEVGVHEYNSWADQQESKVKSEASSRREELISSIDKQDERFIPAIKSVLDKTSDRTVLSKGFDVKDILYHAKGQTADADIKAAEERGFKRGSERPEIVGILNGNNGSPPKKTGPVKGSGLNESQKKRASEMFPEMKEEDAYKMFSETWEEELKKDKNFIG